MKYIKQFGLFWYHFIVGDDWRIALGVIVALGLICVLVSTTLVPLWWLLPLVVAAMLTLSLWIGTHRRS